jgi:diaminobutyrate-2-oxoglutarate transaminase
VSGDGNGRTSAVTGLPGPKSAQLLAEQEARESAARTYPRRLPIAIAGGAGSYLYDLDGNRFLDFLCGSGVHALGHNHPDLVEAARAQLGLSTQMLDFPTRAKQEFTRRLFDTLPGGMRDYRIHFCGPTGADGMDAAVKLCKTFTGRADVIAFHGSFHGSTQSTLAISGLRASMGHLGNLLPGVAVFPYPHCFHCPLDLHPAECQINCFRYLDNILSDPNGGVCLPAAIVMEIVQGEGGVIPARQEFVRQVSELAGRLAIPLVVDEVQTGCGRTGTWFAFEQYGILPDVVVASKALGGGHPASVILYAPRLDVWAAGAHTGTFRGDQLAFAAGAEFMRVAMEQDLLGNVRRAGAHLIDGLRDLAGRYPIVADVRGLGLMLGLEMSSTGAWEAGRVARAVQSRALRRGLLFEIVGRGGSVARFLPPLNLAPAEADEALDILACALAETDRLCRMGEAGNG